MSNKTKKEAAKEVTYDWEEMAMKTPEKALLTFFERVDISKPRTLVLSVKPDNKENGLLTCEHIKTIAALALGSLYGRTVFDVNIWMNPGFSTIFSRKYLLNGKVTATFGSEDKARNAYEHLTKLFRDKTICSDNQKENIK